MNPSLRQAFGLTLLLGAALLESCDKLDDPVIGIVPDCDTSGMVMPQFEALQSDVQRILIEDFTAHQCGNCPPAGLQLADLVASHPDNIVPLAVHAGGLAGTNDEYPTDWTTPEGDAFWADLEFQLNPIGRVNRLQTESTALLPSQWEETLSPLLSQTPSAGLQMVVDRDETTNDLVLHTHVTWFEGVSGPVKLSLLIAENHIIAPQLWYPNVDPPGPGFVEDFEHEHVLRGSVTGAKGLVVADSPTTGDTQMLTYCYEWNDAWDVNASDVIAVLTNESGSVIQTLAVHIVE